MLILSEPRLWERDGISELSWLPDGRILYRIPGNYPDSNFWAVATDPGSGKPVGPPTRLANGGENAKAFSVSADGKRFIYISMHVRDAVYLGNLEFGAKKFNPQRLTLDAWDSLPRDWTRDGKAVLFEAVRGDQYAILAQRIDQQVPKILLSGAESYRWPFLSPAGDRLLYTALGTNHLPDPSKRLMSMPVEGGASSVLLAGEYTYYCGSVRSAICVLGEFKGQQLIFSILDPVRGKGAEVGRVEVHHGSQYVFWSLSPDGNKIAIVDSARLVGEVRILTLADHKVVTLELRGWRWDGLVAAAWSADASHLFATASSKVSVVLLCIDLQGNQRVMYETTPAEGWLGWFPVASPDGHYLAYQKRTFESNVMMLEHF